MPFRPVVLYRGSETKPEELEAIETHFIATSSRMTLQKEDLVIPRYSILPFYKEQEYDINFVGARLINSYDQHRYVANMVNWVTDLKDYTPRTWRNLTETDYSGPFVLKGETNSKKFFWNHSMFAANREAVGKVMGRLLDDSLISTQDIYLREYVPLVTYLQGTYGLPVTKEFRFFILDGKVASSGFYWSSHVEDMQEKGIAIPTPEEVPNTFLQQIINIVEPNIRFWVVDIAQTQSGEWIVIELNDGQMSGLSENNPNILYANMKAILDNSG